MAAEPLIIWDGNAHEHTGPVVNGQPVGYGLVPRNYATHPVGCYRMGAVVDKNFPLIPRSEWASRIAEKVREQSQLSNIVKRGNGGQPIPPRNQRARGYCWQHSGCSALIALRAAMNQPYVSLSAYAGACVIKNFRDEGGWGAQGLDFIVERGLPDEKHWPQCSVDRANDNAETWKNALQYRVTEGFWDLNAAQYDRKLTFDQVGTLLLSNIPVVSDYMWWGHSVCGLDLVDGVTQFGITRAESGKLANLAEFEEIWAINDPVTAGIGVRIWNSWGPDWSENGMGVLTGNKAIPDGATAPRAAIAA